MKRAKWSLMAVLLVVACAGLIATSKADVTTTESLVEQFIANINAKDQDRQWELIHPHCIKELSTLQKEFIDATFSNDLQRTIPEERNIRILPYEAGASLPFGSIAVWPVVPTHRFEVEFSTTDNRTIGIARYIVKKDKEWFIVVPLIHEDRLRQRTEVKSEMDVLGATWDEAPEIENSDDNE